METSPLLFLSSKPSFLSLTDSLAKGERVSLLRPSEGGLAHLLSHLLREVPKELLLVTTSPLEDLQRDLEGYLSLFDLAVRPSTLPALHHSPHRLRKPPLFHVQERLKTFLSLLSPSTGPRVILASPSSLLLPLPPARALKSYFLSIAPDDAPSREAVEEKLLLYGYTATDLVLSPGEFSSRGNLIDLFSPLSPLPFRLDFEGDDLFSLRTFSPSTQRTEERVSRILVPSLTEHLLPDERMEILDLIERGDAPEGLARRGEELDLSWRENHPFPGEELLRLLLPQELSPLPQDLLVAWETVEGIQESLRKLRERWKEESAAGDGLLPDELFTLSPPEPSLSFLDLGAREAAPSLGYLPLALTPATLWKSLAEEREEYLFFADTEKRRHLLEEHLREQGLEKRARVLPGRIPSGFRNPSGGFTFVPTSLLFPPEATKKKEESKLKPFLTKLQDLKEGDLVVHTRYGIGEFLGVQRMTAAGTINDYIVIGYAGSDKVYITVNALDAIYRYSGSGDYRPPLDKLGSKNWERTNERVKAGVFKVAKDLLDLYAKRMAASGVALPHGDDWEEEFIGAFEYEPTEDQSTAWEEISLDMSSDKPMDRLLCGDVGFGKTEVAMRAVFRAVINHKQAVVLCPTTILVYQHMQTFSRRFSTFPIKIASLSRTTTPQEKADILERLRKGTLDILIGTHSLLSDKVLFKNLGLLVIDEEQRFGVKQKEKILKWKEKIDVLTMSATPIPRTLNMAFSGVKDMSLIETPPPGRMSVATYVDEFSADLVKEAVEKELNRGGQVFVVYNNIEKIDSFREFLVKILPGLSIGVIHAKMESRLVERTLMDFLTQRTSLLLSTTIIENGIDIPNVNTLIVVDAQNFGLAQLYQLRGRVGRSQRKAYAYLLINSREALTPKARQRLKAIQEFQDLGSGFRLAAMDLEIRGAGNLLGAEQHGNLEQVGFEYYLRLLENAVKELKGEKVEEEASPEINLPLSYAVPEGYLSSSSQRLTLYQRLSSLQDEVSLDALASEIADRFGPPPLEVENLLFSIRIRFLCKRLKIEKLDLSARTLRILFSPGSPVVDSALVDTVRKRKGRYLGQWEVSFPFPEDPLQSLAPLLQGWIPPPLQA